MATVTVTATDRESHQTSVVVSYAEPGVVTSGTQIHAANTGLAGAGISESTLVTTPGATYGSAFNGQTISGKLFTGRVNITGTGITLQNCKVFTGGLNSFGISISGSNNAVKYCTIVAPAGQSLYEPVFINPGATGALVYRCDISRGENLLTSYGSGQILENYMHDVALDSNPSDHPDGIEIYGGGPLLIARNRITEGALYDSPINAAPYNAYTLTDLTVSDNFLDGGQAMVLIDNQNNSGFIHNTRVLRNVMGGHTNPDTGGSFGRYKALENYDGRVIAQTEAALAANPNGILWPTSGPDVNKWGECSDLTPDRTGQIVQPA